MLRSGKHRTDWAARLGRTPQLGRQAGTRRILIHAVSVGEVNASRLLIDVLLKHADPPVEVVLAVTTDTGLERARSLFGGRLDIVRYPLDLSFAVDRFLDATRPDLIVLVELEVWPNFVASCARRQIPVCVVNGRLTARSHRRYRLIRPLVRATFERLSLVAAQTEAHAARFADLGTRPDRIHITGTMKWDTATIADQVDGAEALAQAMGIDRSRPLIVGGSTAPGEHELLHAATPDGVQLLCAPRKPEWFDGAAKALPGCRRRSAIGGSEPAESEHPTRFLLDTIGELRQAYALADVVVVGRTFTDLGGSDMIEPVALGKATIVGPYVSNFGDVADCLQEAGGLVRTTASELPGVLRGLLESPDDRRRLAERGRGAIRTRLGATARNAELLLSAFRRAP